MGKHITPDIEDIDDIKRFCLRSWLLSISANNVVFVNRVGAEEIEVYPNDFTAPKLLTFQQFLDDIVVGIPDHGYVRSKGRIFYVKVNTNDKFAQGFRSSASTIRCLNRDAPEIMEEEHAVVRQLFFPTYETFSNALDKLESGESLGEPLSCHVALVVPMMGPVQVFYQNIQIGSIVDKALVLQPKYSELSGSVGKLCQTN